MSQTNSFTPEELQELIEQVATKAAAKAIRNFRGRQQREQPVVWMNLQELAQYLPDKPAIITVYEWVRKKKIPFHKGVKKLIFNKAEIDDWIMQSKGGERNANGVPPPETKQGVQPAHVNGGGKRKRKYGQL